MSNFSIIVVIFGSVFGMEIIALFSHKYIMHGFGWGWHRDHHEPHDNMFEKNDLFGIFGAIISISLFAYGRWGGAEVATWMGLGVLFYGIIYTAVHDGLIHQRYFKWVPKSGYAKRLVQAHKLHHATTSKEGGVSFGFLFARNPAVLKQELKKQQEDGIVEIREAIGRGF